MHVQSLKTLMSTGFMFCLIVLVKIATLIDYQPINQLQFGKHHITAWSVSKLLEQVQTFRAAKSTSPLVTEMVWLFYVDPEVINARNHI